MSASVVYMSMSLDGYIAGPDDGPGNPGGDGFGRLHGRRGWVRPGHLRRPVGHRKLTGHKSGWLGHRARAARSSRPGDKAGWTADGPVADHRWTYGRSLVP